MHPGDSGTTRRLLLGTKPSFGGQNGSRVIVTGNVTTKKHFYSSFSKHNVLVGVKDGLLPEKITAVKLWPSPLVIRETGGSCSVLLISRTHVATILLHRQGIKKVVRRVEALREGCLKWDSR